MKKEFIVERQGSNFVLYAGLLDMAHQAGLKSIRTELIQIPTEANNRVAICTAIVTLEKDGERVFYGIGDAAPNNVAPAMQTCLIRMAETRAKARALRDAVNVGMAAFEEGADDSAQDGSPDRGYAPRRPARAAGRQSVSRPEEASPAAEPMRARHQDVDTTAPMLHTQEQAIRNLCKAKGVEPPDMTNWTVAEAAAAIKNIQSVAA